MSMHVEISRERLADLLAHPREDLDFEIKNWLNLQGSNEDRANFAKAVLAISNHGGGFVVLGLVEHGEGFVDSEGRPATFDGYSQDLINGIVQKYCDPPFHCSVHIIPNSKGLLFPMVRVPGGHRVPVRARRAGPNGKIVADNAIYVRKPGPRSETPQSAQDWDALLNRCVRNRRDEMFDQIRDLITGAVPQTAQPDEQPARLDEWISTRVQRWRDLTDPLPANAGPRLLHGRYSFAYEIIGEPRQIALPDLPEVLRASAVRYTGWPPFWYPTRAGIEPYPNNGTVECWLGGDSRNPDAAHSDFWCIDPNGFAFLLRGFQEDAMWETAQLGRVAIEPKTVFDIAIPIWYLLTPY